jgi:hypothetical protein
MTAFMQSRSLFSNSQEDVTTGIERYKVYHLETLLACLLMRLGATPQLGHALHMQIAVVWDVTPANIRRNLPGFGGRCFILLQNKRVYRRFAGRAASLFRIECLLAFRRNILPPSSWNNLSTFRGMCCIHIHSRRFYRRFGQRTSYVFIAEEHIEVWGENTASILGVEG